MNVEQRKDALQFFIRHRRDFILQTTGADRSTVWTGRKVCNRCEAIDGPGNQTHCLKCRENNNIDALLEARSHLLPVSYKKKKRFQREREHKKINLHVIECRVSDNFNRNRFLVYYRLETRK